ncbi:MULTISPECIES: site-specific integrase [Actinosynnema]|uniref:tyrosine-type recombinase/integrase n=1 Tax=Actinosynnema TaxID=40566 RepID=UPI0020A3B740|nr:site-specific integrase [Actinosynnema pretiosum]
MTTYGLTFFLYGASIPAAQRFDGSGKARRSMAWVEKHGGGYRVRYRHPAGGIATEVGFVDRTEAADRALEIGLDLRKGKPPVAAPKEDLLLADWVERWVDAHDVGATTWAKYRSHLRNHILPRFGGTPLREISRMTVKAWVKQLRRGLAERTVADIVTLLSMVLGEAVEEDLIGRNPCQRLRVNAGDWEERPHASPQQVLAIAGRCSPAIGVLVVTAAYTGLRWGELAGLRWSRVDLDGGVVSVDPQKGALHEVGGKLVLGPPKTKAGVRPVHLPPFLVGMLRKQRERQGGEHVFTGPGDGLLRRANFRRRVWLPAVSGDLAREWGPILAGLHFHDLRHTQKTWLIEDGVPEVLQCKRLGHRMAGVSARYSHVTQVMVDAMLRGLQARWEQALGHPFRLTTYGADDHSMIVCSQSAPKYADRPVGDDHLPAA